MGGDRFGSYAAFEIQMLSPSAIKLQGDFRIFKFASAIRQQKFADDSAKTFVYYVHDGFSMPRHFAKSYDLVF